MALQFLSFAPGVIFLYFLIRSTGVARRMADDINLRVSPRKQLSFFSLRLLFSWKKHERFFPDRTEVRVLYKRYAIRAIAWWCITLLTVLMLGLYR